MPAPDDEGVAYDVVGQASLRRSVCQEPDEPFWQGYGYCQNGGEVRQAERCAVRSPIGGEVLGPWQQAMTVIVGELPFGWV